MGKITTIILNPWVLVIVLYILLYLIRLQQGGFNLQTDIFQKQRGVLVQKIGQFLPSTQASLLSGILLGVKQDLPFNLRLALRDTSTLHIVVASGQNLTMLAGFVMHLAGLIKRRTAILSAFAIIILYTLFTGAQIPIVRAAIMFGFASFAQVYGRQNSGLWVLAVTAALLLLINPRWILDLSFQLSFLASFGVIVVAPILERLMRILPVVIRGNLAVTLGAQLMVLPVIASNFHQISFVSIIANLLVLWIVVYIMGGGFLFLAVALVWQFGGEILGLVLSVMLTYFIYIVQFFAGLPFAWEYIGEQEWVVWVGYYLMLGGILIGLSRIQNNSE